MKKILSFIIAFAMIMSMSSVAMAAGVATIGSEEYATLLDAIKNAEPNDTIVVKAGVHVVGDLTHVHYKNEVIPDGLTIEGEDGAVIDGLYFNTNTVPKNLTVKNITFDASHAATGKGFFSQSGVENLTIEDCYFINGAFLTCSVAEAKNVVVKKCTFDGVAEGSTPVYIQKANGLTVDGCTIKNGGYNAIQCSNSVSGDVTITNNTFEGIKSRNIYLAGLKDDYAGTLTVTGNTFCIPKELKEDGNFIKTSASVNPVSIGANNYPVIPDESELGKYFTNVEAGSLVNPPSEPVATPKSRDSIKVTYNGGNSFSTSKSDVPTGVEIDGGPVAFSGNGSSFTVSGIPADAKWVTVRWNSTSVTTNFTPSGAYVAEVNIPKTGDMPIWAAVAAFFGF